jgi:hypothetical protein
MLKHSKHTIPIAAVAALAVAVSVLAAPASTAVGGLSPIVGHAALVLGETGCDLWLPGEELAVGRFSSDVALGRVEIAVYHLGPASDWFEIELFKLDSGYSYAQFANRAAEDQRRMEAGEPPLSDPVPATFLVRASAIPSETVTLGSLVVPGTYAVVCNRFRDGKRVGLTTAGPMNVVWAYEVTFAKLVRTGRARADVRVRVDGPENGQANLRIEISRGSNHVVQLRTVPANRIVRLRGLRTPNVRGRLSLQISVLS